MRTFKLKNRIYNFKVFSMKILFHVFLIFIIFGFKPSLPKVFNSYNNRITLEADDTFFEKANMRGVEIYIFKKNINFNSIVSIVISKDEGLLPSTNLEKYSASKIFLQTSVLGTSANSVLLKKVNGVKMKMYEYNYSDKNLLKKHTIVYHAIVGSDGYQIAVTGHPDLILLNRKYFDKIINSIKIN